MAKSGGSPTGLELSRSASSEYIEISGSMSAGAATVSMKPITIHSGDWQRRLYRWMQRFLPLFSEVARKYRDPVGPDWRVDETYARIRGHWPYIYRAIDGPGQVVDA